MSGKNKGEKRSVINPYGTEWNENMEGCECEECGVKHTPHFLIFEYGLPDPMPFCSNDCVMRHFQNKWATEAIHYCNSKEGKQ